MARLRTQRTALTLAMLGASVSFVAPLAGCRGDRTDKRPHRFFPDMDKQPKWKPQSETEFFALQDGSRRSQRVPDEHAIAFGRRSFDPSTYGAEPWASGYMTERASFLAEDDAFYRGKGADGEFIDVMPVDVTPELLALGRQKFEINCVACHGYLGDGQGMVAKAGMSPVPANFHDEKYKDRSQRTAKDGYIYDVVRHGLWNEVTGENRMPSYGHNITPEETWAIIAYVRALQASQDVAIGSASIPEATRVELIRRRPEPKPETAPGAEGGDS
ncbi:MAG: cytochrome c [Phycisphaerales bacterium]